MDEQEVVDEADSDEWADVENKDEEMEIDLKTKKRAKKEKKEATET